MAELDGKIALITGGGSGIGAATAGAFRQAGAKVLVTDIDEAAGRRVADAMGEAGLFVRGDHRDRADNERAVARAVEAWGGLDILFNNAGAPAQGPIETIDDATLERVLGINLIGPYRMSQAALPALRARAGEGRTPCILFTASIQALMTRPNFTLYGASKHGLGGLIGSLALELAPEGIRVNGLCPGPVDTALFRASAIAVDPDVDKAMARFRSGIPMGRLITVEDVAEAAVFLCSDRARSITGAMLPVDGGITAR